MCPDKEDNCCYGHPRGHPAHKTPTVKGKPFSFLEHKDSFQEKGLAGPRQELKDEALANKMPPGAHMKGKVNVYAVRHFA